MYSNSKPGLRIAALVGAGSVTASILLGVALLAQPTMPVADPQVAQELMARAVTSAIADGEAIERLRITVVGTRDARPASAPAMVRARAECPPNAHGGSAGRPSEV